jgi:uncharacterized protein involved in exopolysaccharide biosynthesis
MTPEIDPQPATQLPGSASSFNPATPWWPHIRQHLPLLVLAPVLVGGISLGLTYLMPPIFTARTTFLPPQAQQSGAASALASLGSITGLPAASGGARGGADQYVGFLQSVTISDRIVQQFELQKLYDTPFKASARKALIANVRIASNKKDGLIAIEVDDTSPQRAADIANRFVEELRRMTAGLAVTEAQQRRVFFDRQLAATRDKLAKAQLALQSSGFGDSALRTDPKVTAEAYARLRSESVAQEMRLNALRTTMAAGAIELQQAESNLASIQRQLSRVESTSSGGTASSPSYVERFREFKYQETLFDMFARQLELARSDEAREGPLIQVVDVATAPEVKSRPKRLNAAMTGAAAGLAAALAYVLLRRRPWS